ncbi:SdpI family protein [Clostridia bacterium]|nr:SdpI family protein [Clostridia bacterium]
MNKKRVVSFKKGDAILVAFIGLMFVIGLLAYRHLPAQIPIHWNINGEVDNYGSRAFGVFGIPFITLGVFLLFYFLPNLDPRKHNYPQFARSYQAIKLVTIVFMFMLYCATILYSLGVPVNISLVVNLLVGIMFIIIGNYLGKVKHNYFVGIKTPWTLADEEVWKKTHRLAAPFMVIGGVVFIAGAFIQQTAVYILSFTVLMIAVLVPTVYSYLLFRKLHPNSKD